MKLLRLSNNDVLPVIAKAYEYKNKLQYFIKFGNVGKDLWELRLMLNNKYFVPNSKEDKLEMTDDDYFLTPVKDKDGNILKDNINNQLYMISKDDNGYHKKDVVLFWEIFINNKYDYTINGDYNIIGKGYSGKERNDKLYIYPIVAIELLSDCELTLDTESYTKNIKFNYNITKFDIGITNKT